QMPRRACLNGGITAMPEKATTTTPIPELSTPLGSGSQAQPLEKKRRTKSGQGEENQRKRDKEKVDPLSGAEDKDRAQPLQTVPPGKKANASSATIPGTGKI